jgi:hypothetical protein
VLAWSDPRQPQPIAALIEPQRAADKMVFAKTHIWEQRRPTAWSAAFGPQGVRTADT